MAVSGTITTLLPDKLFNLAEDSVTPIQSSSCSWDASDNFLNRTMILGPLVVVSGTITTLPSENLVNLAEDSITPTHSSSWSWDASDNFLNRIPILGPLVGVSGTIAPCRQSTSLIFLNFVHQVN